MSLINEALKKAQRSRSGDPGDLAPVPGGARITKRGQPPSAKAIVLYAAGALVLFVLAVVGTVLVLNRPSPSATIAAAKPAAPAKAVPEAGSPAIVAPMITVPPPEKPPEPIAGKISEAVPAASRKNSPANDGARPTAPRKSPEPSAPTPDAVTNATPTPPVAPVPAAPPATPDERINAYLDDLRITAVRIQGNDSRVMINERVFRLNDIVDRHLGLRLTKVEANQIIFTDGNGVAYVKYF